MRTGPKLPRAKGFLCQIVGTQKYTGSVLRCGGKRPTPSAKAVSAGNVLRSPMATPGWPILSTRGKAKVPSQSRLTMTNRHGLWKFQSHGHAGGSLVIAEPDTPGSTSELQPCEPLDCAPTAQFATCGCSHWISPGSLGAKKSPATSLGARRGQLEDKSNAPETPGGMTIAAGAPR
jgi:hypothetical protein